MPWGMRPTVALLLTLIVIGCAQRELNRYQDWTARRSPVASDLPIYVSMASNLRYGFFVHSARSDAEFSAHPTTYRSHPTAHPEELRGYYQNDVGLSLIIWLADTVFANRASPVDLLAWLQMTVGLVDVLLMFYVGRRIAGDGMGLLCAATYAGLLPFAFLSASFPYYCFWQIPFAIGNLAFLTCFLDPALGQRRMAARILAAAACGLMLGLAAMVRSSFLAVGLISALFVLVRHRRCWRAAMPVAIALLVAQVLVMAPIFYRSYQRFGRLMPPRLIWHTIYVGLGCHPNPYGITWNDGAAGAFAQAHGVRFDDPDWIAKYEDVLHREVSRIRREHPWLMPRNAVLNFWDGLVVFDQALKFNLAVGQLGIWIDLPTDHFFMALLVLPQIGYFAWRLRRKREGWCYAAALGQGGYFLMGVSCFCPPFLGYNAGYLPTFAVCVAGTVLAVLCVLRDGARAVAGVLRPAAAALGEAK